MPIFVDGEFHANWVFLAAFTNGTAARTPPKSDLSFNDRQLFDGLVMNSRTMVVPPVRLLLRAALPSHNGGIESNRTIGFIVRTCSDRFRAQTSQIE